MSLIHWMEVLHLGGVDCVKWWHRNMKLSPQSSSNSLGLVEIVPFEYESQYESKSLFWSIHPHKQKTAQSQVELLKFTDDIAYVSQKTAALKLCIAGSRIDVRIWLSVLDYSDEHCEYHHPDAWLVFMVEGCLRSWCLVTFLLDEGLFLFQCLRQGCCVLRALAVTCTFFKVAICNPSNMNKNPVTFEWSTSSLFLHHCVFLVFQLKWC